MSLYDQPMVAVARDAFRAKAETLGWSLAEEPVNPAPILSEQGLSKLYLIVTPGRAGSTWLAKSLGKTGAVGQPFELFADDVLPRRAEELGARSLQEFVEKAITASASGGVFGFKTTPARLVALQSFVDWEGCWRQFGVKVIDLRRENIVAQAHSMVKAVASGVWHVVDGEEQGRLLGGLAEQENPAFLSEEKMSRILTTLVANEVLADRYFKEIDVRTMRLSYEMLRADSAFSVRRCFHWITGTMLPADSVIESGTAKMSSQADTAYQLAYYEKRSAVLEDVFRDRSGVELHKLFGQLEPDL